MRALDTAATGMKAMSTQVDIIANNLANVNTTGFKQSRALFQDIFYQTIRQPGTVNGLSEVNPTGAQVGTGVALATTADLFTEGDFVNTGRSLDIAVKGKGFFQVAIDKDIGEGIGYTRDGSFYVNANGQMVLGGPDGYLVDPAVTIPTDYTSISITPDGVVNVTTPGNASPQQVGNLTLATFTNPEGLLKIGSNLYVRSASSGDPVTNTPGQGGAGRLIGDYLEKSNVDPVLELTQLIQAQRAFELNGRVITSGDQMMQTVNNLKA